MNRIPGIAFGAAAWLTAIAAAAAPPPELSVSAWADAHRVIAAESGARITGQWRTDFMPFLRRPMDVSGVNDPSASVWVRWSAKTGKTQIPLNAVLHAIDTEPRSIMTVCPSLGEAQRFEREVFTPAVNASPKVRVQVMASTSRSGEGSTTRYKRFRNGFNRIVSASTEKELQASDIGLLVFEEPSSFPADTGGRGDPIRQARARTIAWGDEAKELGGGTPKFVGDCRVSEEVERRTLERYYLPCPHCGTYQLLLWENMARQPSGRPYFQCAGTECGAEIHETARETMLARGQWIACFVSTNALNPVPPTAFAPEALPQWQARDTEGRDPSFDGIWQAYSPLAEWSRIWREWDEAAGDPEKLAVFTQQVLGRPFEPVYERPKADPLFEAREPAARLARLTPGAIPEWAWTIFFSGDLQGYGIRWSVYAVGPGPDGATGRRYARIDGGLIAIPPVDPRAWTELAQLTRRTYEGPHIKPIGFDRKGIDTGGHHTSQAYAFCATHRDVWALKGGRDRAALPLTRGQNVKGRVGARTRVSLPLHLIGTHKLKKDVYFGLSQTLAGIDAQTHLPGSLTLPATATRAEFAELTAEVLLPPDPAKRRREEEWVRQPAAQPNEELDLAVYALALAWSYLPDRMGAEDWAKLVAERRRDVATVDALPLEAAWTPSLFQSATDATLPVPVVPEAPDGGGSSDRAGTVSRDAVPAQPSTSARALIERMMARNRTE